MEEQSKFHAGHSCIDNISCLPKITEKKFSTKRDLQLLFIDLTKAYDKVPFKMIWKTLENTNINNAIIKALHQLYRNSIINIMIGKYVWKGFTVTKALKQKCCLSPTLLKIYIKYALQTWKRKCYGIRLRMNYKNTYTLQFVDDQAFIAQDKEA